MQNIFHFLSLPAIFISFSTSVLALPPPSGDEAQDSSSGKREKSGPASFEKPSKKLKNDKNLPANPTTIPPHAPSIPAASLSSSSTFIPAAALSALIPTFFFEKGESSQPLAVRDLGDDFAVVKQVEKPEKKQYHPLVGEIAKILNKSLDTQLLGECEKLIQKEIDKLIQIKKEKSKEVFSHFFKQYLSQFNIKPENSDDVLGAVLAIIESNQKEDFDTEDASDLPQTLENRLRDHVDALYLNQCKSLVSQFYPQVQRPLAAPQIQPVEQQRPQIAAPVSSPIKRPLKWMSVSPAGMALQTTTLSVNSTEQSDILPICIDSVKRLSTLVNRRKKTGRNLKIVVSEIYLFQKFNQGEEQKVFKDLIFLLEHLDISQLKFFALMSNKVENESAIKIFSLIKKSKNLISFSMFNTKIGKKGVLYLAEHFIPSLNKLTHLSLIGNNAGPDAMLALIQSLAKSPCLLTLTHLGLGSNNAGKEAIVALAGLLPRMPNLDVLDIQNSNAGPDAMLALNQSLAKSPCLPKLKYLGVGSNNAGDGAIGALASLLPSMLNLNELDIQNSNVGPVAMLTFIQSLENSQCLPNLRLLGLGSNNAGEAASNEFAKLIPKAKSLTFIDFSFNNYGTQAALNIAESLIHIQNCKEIRLYSKDLDKVTMKNILILLSNIKSLEEIYLTTHNDQKTYNDLIEFLKTNYPDMVQKLRHEPNVK